MMNIAMELNMDELETVSGGEGMRDHPYYNLIKALYVEKGARTASAACSHYFGDEIAVVMIRLISEEVDQGAEWTAENNCNF